MAIDIPPDAECAMIPFKWLPVLQEIAHGPFIPIDFPIPIVVSKMVPDDEIWFCKTSKVISTAGDIEIIKKEKITNEMFKTDDVSSNNVDGKLPPGPDASAQPASSPPDAAIHIVR